MTALASTTTNAATTLSLLQRNLRALVRSSPEAANAIQHATPRPEVEVFQAADGAPSARVGSGGSRRLLASAHWPLTEALRLAESVDIAESAVFIVSGLGVGHHVAALARRLNKTGIVVVFEPDLGLLRALFERVDFAEVFGSGSVALVTDPDDSATISRLVDGVEGLVAMGVTLIEHPPSRAGVGDAGKVFHRNFVDVVRAVRMTVTTTLVQVKATLRNLTQNLDRYARSPGITELAGCCAGRPGIVVSAGPSLARNLHLLGKPGVREQFAIVAVQTVLKPMLDKGIRPHFVTALDHSEISRRFYEGLTAADVEGITLVVDPKVNPAVLEAWPGRVRTQADRHLDLLLGPSLTRAKGTMKPGATVAHLAYYLARFLGCDPVALIGQDLGFTDGQYYSSGAAIHNVWACELNRFHSLELLEWERILRMGRHLRRAMDVFDRPVFTDEQMSTYLVQFERDFKADVERGLRVVDATEGGVRKSHTQVQSLGEFLDLHASPHRPPVEFDRLTGAGEQFPAMRKIEERVASVRAAAFRVAELSRKADTLLAELAEHQEDQLRVNRIIGRIEELTAEVGKQEPAATLVQSLNQTGVFNRLKADRAIQVESLVGTITPMERQRRQAQRDRNNVQSMATAADDFGELLDSCMRTLRGGARVTREPGHAPGSAAMAPAHDGGSTRADHVVVLAAIVPILGSKDHLRRPLSGAPNVLVATLTRLAASKMLGGAPGTRAQHASRGIFIATDDEPAVRDLIAGVNIAVPITVVPASWPDGGRRAASMRTARAPAWACWRGGIAGATIFDEVFDPRIVQALLKNHNLDAAVLCGPDWCLVDPALTDAIIERHLSAPDQRRICFTQAAPGLSPCLVSRVLVDDLAAAEPTAGTFASIGGLLGYIPATPMVDLINMPECVAVGVGVRDLGLRMVADRPGAVEAIARITAQNGWEQMDADAIAAHMPTSPAANAHLELELRMVDGQRCLPVVAAMREIDAFAETAGCGAMLTITGANPLGVDEPLDHPEARTIADHARARGLCLHVRTSLLRGGDPAAVESVLVWLASGAVDVVSVDVLAESREAYLRITGWDHYGKVRSRLERLSELRNGAKQATGNSPWTAPWILARLTRCDAVYSEIEAFHQRWVLRHGWAVIDPLREPRPNERISALAVPPQARRWEQRRVRVIGADGQSLREHVS